MRRAQGHSLVELLVACALFSLIVSIAFGALELASRARAGAESRLDPRKANRALLDRLSTTLRRASYICADPVTFGGHDYSDIPRLETPGRSLVAIVPEDDDPRFGLYSVVGVYARPRQPVDPANPHVLQVVIHTVNGVQPTSAGLPASIDFAALPPGGMRVFDTYLDALEFNVLSPHRDRVSMSVVFERDMPRGPRARESYSTEVFLRNQ